MLRIDKESESFWAKLADLNEEGVTEESEFSFDEISRPDIPLLREGAVFYRNIGYTDSKGGTRSRTSSLRFRRLLVNN